MFLLLTQHTFFAVFSLILLSCSLHLHLKDVFLLTRGLVKALRQRSGKDSWIRIRFRGLGAVLGVEMDVIVVRDGVLSKVNAGIPLMTIGLQSVIEPGHTTVSPSSSSISVVISVSVSVLRSVNANQSVSVPSSMSIDVAKLTSRRLTPCKYLGAGVGDLLLFSRTQTLSLTSLLTLCFGAVKLPF